MVDIPTDLMASRIINAAGTLTRLSGARVSTAVAAAMSQAAKSSFDMWALQAAASARIAQATGGEAGLVAPERTSPEYLAGFVRSEIEKWAAPIKASGVAVE